MDGKLPREHTSLEMIQVKTEAFLEDLVPGFWGSLEPSSFLNPQGRQEGVSPDRDTYRLPGNSTDGLQETETPSWEKGRESRFRAGGALGVTWPIRYSAEEKPEPQEVWLPTVTSRRSGRAGLALGTRRKEAVSQLATRWCHHFISSSD